MSPEELSKSKMFMEDQVEKTTKDLFNARSVKQIQFLQGKLIYLKKRMNQNKTRNVKKFVIRSSK